MVDNLLGLLQFEVGHQNTTTVEDEFLIGDIDESKLSLDVRSHDRTCLCWLVDETVVVGGDCVLSSLSCSGVCCCTLSSFGFTWTEKLRKGFKIINLKLDCYLCRLSNLHRI